MPQTASKRDLLTTYQRRLVGEIEEIACLLKLDYAKTKSYERAARTPLLEMMRRKLIISEVITSYTLTDEHLNVCLCHYFFGRKRGFIKLWKTKRFKVFNSEAGIPLVGARALSSSSSTRSIVVRRWSSDQIFPISGRV